MGKRKKEAKLKSKAVATNAPRKTGVIRFAIIFLLSYTMLSICYHKTRLQVIYTDWLLLTAGKLCALTTADPIKVFFYIPQDGIVEYDTVLGMVVDQRNVDAYNQAISDGIADRPQILAKRFVIAIYPIAFLPMSIILSLVTAIPIPWRRKLKSIPLALLLT